jgi:hypothetical protein
MPCPSIPPSDIAVDSPSQCHPLPPPLLAGGRGKPWRTDPAAATLLYHGGGASPRGWSGLAAGESSPQEQRPALLPLHCKHDCNPLTAPELSLLHSQANGPVDAMAVDPEGGASAESGVAGTTPEAMGATEGVPQVSVLGSALSLLCLCVSSYQYFSSADISASRGCALNAPRLGITPPLPP